MTHVTQETREQEMFERGRARAEAAIRRTLQRGEAPETPAGRALQRRALAALIEAIKAYVTKSYSGLPQHVTSSAIILKDINPELAAFVTVRAVLTSAAGGFGLKATARQIAANIEAELLGDRFEAANPALYEAVIKRAKSRALTPARQGAAVKMAAVKFSVCPVSLWTQSERLKLGTTLVELTAQSTGLFTVSTSLRNNRTSHIIQFTAEIEPWFAQYNQAAALTRPMFLPTVVPPRPWDSVDASPYWSSRIPRSSLLSRSFPTQLDHLRAADLSAVFEGLNALQETPWRINRRVLEVMRAAWDQGTPLPCIPQRDETPIPERPAEVENDVKGGALRKEWRQKVRAIYDANALSRAGRFEFARLLSIAEDNKDQPAIFFPYRCDFRGRVYAASTSLNPQGTDESKALLQFADGKPLGERGVYWLGVHGANLFGNDKVSLDERFAWAQEHKAQAAEVAADPLRNLWWTEADKPWSFLAWCFEWCEAAEGSLSHLPIAMDGSCNGIQHFSAMLRDPVGGAAVNLVPADKPSDIYGRVAERVVEQLQVLAKSDDPDAWMADAWVRFGIDRKITKRAVMVLPYGGTFGSCLDYVRDAVQERISGGVANPFGDSFPKACGLLARHVWSSISDVVVAARTAMGWLQKCALVASKAGIPLRWSTPSGFVVVQDYRELSASRIKTRFCGQTIWFVSGDTGPEINRKKQSSAVSPNFVHSLDAAVLMRTVVRAKREGQKHFAMIHDSYGVHAADTEDFNRTIREEFVGMYVEHDVLAEFRAQLSAQLPPAEAAKLPPLPKMGDLNLDLVLESKYFFA
jgi:DNA-directed RNA polymerase